MTLTFPNFGRSYDARRDLIRCWGYDSALEVACFVETSALCERRPETGKLEAAYLDAFDAAREQILAVAHKAYSQARPGPFLLAEADFCLQPASQRRQAAPQRPFFPSASSRARFPSLIDSRTCRLPPAIRTAACRAKVCPHW